MIEPLISIIVITYKSGELVIDTLESIKNQTYKNYEIIISDDASNDKTKDIIKSWSFKNEEFCRQKKLKLIFNEENKGVSENCNTGIRSANGEYIKIIAGDDLLSEDALENMMRFINDNDTIDILFSKVKSFVLKHGDYLWGEELPLQLDKKIFSEDVDKQKKELFTRNFCTAPTAIIRKELFDKFGYFDKDIRNMEDWPMWIKLSLAGVKLSYMDKITVLYRKHENSLSNHRREKPISENYYQSYKVLYRKYIKPAVKNEKVAFKWHVYLNYFITHAAYKLGNNRLIYNMVRSLKITDIYTWKRRSAEIEVKNGNK